MERQENIEYNADIKVKIKLETDVEERMPSYSDNEDDETIKVEGDIYLKEESRNPSYIGANIMEYEEEAVAFIKPEGSDSVKSDSEEQKEDIEGMKEVKVLYTKFDKFTCVVCDRYVDKSAPMGVCKHYNEIVLFCKDCIKPKGTKYMCLKCSYGSSNRGDLIKHVFGVHRKLKKYKCEECNSAFTLSSNLKVHVRSAHRKLNFACQQCDRSFSNRDYLAKHIDFIHRRLNIFTCDLCHKEFRNQKILKHHIDRVHRKIKEFECKECKNAFFTKYSLALHVNCVHRKVRPFACDTCNRSFLRQSLLRKHINSVHLKNIM